MSDEDNDALDAAFGVLTEGEALGRYELLAPIGRGGMAIVWAARVSGTRGFSKILAVKMMLPALSSDPRFERMFLAEAEIASKIGHPNVCEVVDLGEQGGVLYLVMEWIDGEPLSRVRSLCRTAGREIPHGVSARLVAQAARGLQAAHDLRNDNGELVGVVHRDVSPQNILVTRDGIVKVVDFGVARVTRRRDHATDTGFIKGKVAYLAPEQIEQVAVDGRADVFALGVVLYELVTGTHPFRASTELSTLLAIASADPAPDVPCDCPAELRAILERALEKEPARRWPSMRELAAALEAFAASSHTGTDDVAAFIAATLDERREKVARELRDGARAADARPKADVRPNAAPVEGPSPPRPRRSARRAATVASFAGVALVAGGISALFSRGAGRANAGPLTAVSATTPAMVAAPELPVAPEGAASPTPRATSSPRNAASTATARAPAPKRAASTTRPILSSAPTASSVAPARTNPLDSWD